MATVTEMALLDKKVVLLIFYFLYVLGGCSTGSTASQRQTQNESSSDRNFSPRVLSKQDSVSAEFSQKAVTKKREIIIASAGDLLVHRKVLESAQAHKKGFQYVLAALKKSINDASTIISKKSSVDPIPVITLVNLETPLTEAYLSPINMNPPVLGTTPELASELAKMGVKVVNIANNHAFDQTANGLADTISTAQKVGLGVVGAGTDMESAFSPWITEQSGLKIGFLGFAQHVNKGPGRKATVKMHVARLRKTEKVLHAITKLREEVDIIVVAVHWSYDFFNRAAHPHKKLARKMIDAGADLILGTGPHVLQEIEKLHSSRGDALVAYSLGNLISNQGLRYKVGHKIGDHEHPVAITPGTRDSILLSVRLRSEKRGQVEIVASKAYAMWVMNNFWERRNKENFKADIYLARLRDVESDLKKERLAAIKNALGPNTEIIP